MQQLQQQVKRKPLLDYTNFGTDQNSSFFRKSKMRCWKIVQDYLSTFSTLGKEFEMTDVLIKELEVYVCHLYGCKISDVNALGNEILWRTSKTSH